MSSLERRPAGNYRIAVEFGRAGGKRQRVRIELETKDEREARARQAEVDLTLRRIKEGFLDLPEGADLATFLASGGRKATQPKVEVPRQAPVAKEAPPPPPPTIADAVADWLAAYPRESRTRYKNHSQLRPVLRNLGGTRFGDLTPARAQAYAAARLAAGIRPVTVSKELRLLFQVWRWGAKQGLPIGRPTFDRSDVRLPKDPGRERFRTAEEIRHLVAVRGPSARDEGRLWRTLYLSSDEVKAAVALAVREPARTYAPAMVAIVAFTGMRRAEMIRSERADWRLEEGVVDVREKKRSTDREFTLRTVPIPQRLCEILSGWFETSPPSRWAVSHDGVHPLTVDRADDGLYRTFAKHDTFRHCGFHTFRHSYASIMAARGLDEGRLMALLGHVEPRTLALYRHFYPDDIRDAVRGVF